ncbi:acetylglutamate kinase [Galbibacter sp. EGI 63066]|uniref:acetylglutamate kinase n=1 Tax=Galbibacter sp. EGI 63066 TaxID=2993559 RepID=UPI002248DCFA|nr:acetylglutamate kinase [Galbibacter sp. EGI 63066]MCX2678720.1 acetylglutamate kinase [Galbibacter sp. EGI 63066]
MKTSIVKIGGNLIEDENSLDTLLKNFSKIEGLKVLVHGGGKKATQMSAKLGIETHMVDGRRITDKDTLNVITMVYGGLVNKTIVAKLQALDCNAVGLSGADLNSIKSMKRPVKTYDFGFVGDVTEVNSKMFSLLLNNGISPVCCAITHDGNGQLFNTNADTIASEIAIALSNNFETELYYCFEKKGVLRSIDDKDSVITDINSKSYLELLEQNIIADGMLPKLHNCFNAVKNNVSKVFVGNIDMIANPDQLKTTITL